RTIPTETAGWDRWLRLRARHPARTKAWMPAGEPCPAAGVSFSRRRLQARKRLVWYSLVHPFPLTLQIFTDVSLIIHEPCRVSDRHSGEVAVFNARFGQWSSPEVCQIRLISKFTRETPHRIDIKSDSRAGRKSRTMTDTSRQNGREQK